MPITFQHVSKGSSYSRPQLAQLWGYTSFHAISRGVVTPKGEDKIVLFVTEEKQAVLAQYQDRLVGNVLHWEGPTDHFAEQRMVNASKTREQIHLFYRQRHHTDFTYMGQVSVSKFTLHTTRPSSFELLLS